MDLNILNKEIQDFIRLKAKDGSSIPDVLLGKNPFPEVSIAQIANQINGLRKAALKFPIWLETNNVYYPPNVNIEQTSSAATARYKSSLVSGNTLIDLTGGFGIDSFYFNRVIDTVVHCEMNTTLSNIAQHNFKQLGAKEIICHAKDGIEILKETGNVDWLYIDPSRRDRMKGKVFFLEDCIPNVPEQLTTYYQYTHNILIKTAPLLDITAGLRALDNVKEIHIIAVKNDVKELLWVLHKGFENTPTIHTINILGTQYDTFSFQLNDPNVDKAPYSDPLKYLFEPNAAIMKSAGFDAVSKQFSIAKLGLNSHLYTANTMVDFPGRTFEIIQACMYSKKEVKLLGISKANITVRNFPITVAEIRKKYKIKEGGKKYLFFTTLYDTKKVLLICKKYGTD